MLNILAAYDILKKKEKRSFLVKNLAFTGVVQVCLILIISFSSKTVITAKALHMALESFINQKQYGYSDRKFTEQITEIPYQFFRFFWVAQFVTMHAIITGKV